MIYYSVKFCIDQIKTFEVTLNNITEKVNKMENVVEENAALKFKVTSLNNRVKNAYQTNTVRQKQYNLSINQVKIVCTPILIIVTIQVDKT